MPRKGENIYKRKDGRWEGRYLKRIPGKKSSYGYVYAKTYREAKEKLCRAAADWQASAPAIAGTQVSLTDAALTWQQHIAAQVKESTLVKYHTILQKHLIPGLGNVLVSDLTYVKIEAFAQECLCTLAPRTVSDILTVLRGILRFAQQRGVYVPYNVTSFPIRRPATTIRVLTLGEQAALCRHIFDNLSLRNAGILLSLCTGLRVGEICALRWEDISLQEHILYVRRTMQRLQNLSSDGPRTLVIESTPKTATSARAIPLSEDLVRVLLSLPGPNTGYFLTGQTDRYVEPRAMQYHFGRIAAACGIPDANYHALRHTFATRCVELGLDAKCLSELLGHATVTMTLDRYVHPTIEHKRASGV